MTGFNRMTLPVRDWRVARDFYVAHLGFVMEWENPAAGLAAIADSAGFKIFLNTGQPANCAGLSFAIEVGDVDVTHRRLVAAGAEVTHPPQKTFWGYGAEARDPDGYVLRLWDAASMREKG